MDEPPHKKNLASNPGPEDSQAVPAPPILSEAVSPAIVEETVVTAHEILTAEIVPVGDVVEASTSEVSVPPVLPGNSFQPGMTATPPDAVVVFSTPPTSVVAEPHACGEPVLGPPNEVPNGRPKSWIFRLLAMLRMLASRLFGIASIIFLLAFAANIPIVQFLSFGYLLEVSGRLARKQNFRDAMIGLKKASVLGGIVLGTWLTLIPIRFVSRLWYEAYLIDPTSQQTQNMRTFQTILIALVVIHIGSVWICGGKLRYFFWPIIAPFSFGIWFARRIAGGALFRKILSLTIGLISPALVDDLCNAKPVSDWFVPALLWKRIRAGNLYTKSRDRVWDFAKQLNLFYYFQLGLKGFAGTFLWLLLPTSLLVIASYTEDAIAILSGLFGVLLAIPIFMTLPFLQAHFATDGKIKRFLEVRAVFKNFGRAPFAHLLALFLTLVLALPLFFLKIEEIPGELLWTLSVVFVVFSWPARICVGWAYGRGAKRERNHRWWVRYPVLLSAAPVALTFALILTSTRYISWYGALSLFENHVFLLPAPFWL